MTFLWNSWYMAAWPEAVGRQPHALTILDKPVVLYRREDGAPVALADTCPHRFAPLSRGGLVGDDIECRYHGLRFDARGHCVLNPHDGRITSKMRVESHPVVERHGIVWIWMGDPDAADPVQIPDLGFMAPDPARRTVHHYMKGAFPVDLLIDNLLDLSHTDYLHRGTFSGGIAEYTDLAVEQQGDEVVVERTQLRTPPPPRYEHVGELVDVTYRMRWFPSQVVAFRRFITPTGEPRSMGVEGRFCHMATPETAATTHYFHSVTRTDNLDDPSVDEILRGRHQAAIVEEDGAMLEAVHRRMGGADLMNLAPVILSVDAGAMRVRAVMRRRLASEVATAQLPSVGDRPVPAWP